MTQMNLSQHSRLHGPSLYYIYKIQKYVSQDLSLHPPKSRSVLREMGTRSVHRKDLNAFLPG